MLHQREVDPPCHGSMQEMGLRNMDTGIHSTIAERRPTTRLCIVRRSRPLACSLRGVRCRQPCKRLFC